MQLELLPTDLLFFVDDTGHEEFADFQHPVFGLGGCALLASEYESTLRPAWKQMKERHFGGGHNLIHASDMKSPSEGQLCALSDFFATISFQRFCAIAPEGFVNLSPFSTYHAMAHALADRFRDIAARYRTERLVIIFEESGRTNELAESIFPRLNFHVVKDGESTPISVEWLRMGKKQGEPGLEVADFIMHAAGRRTRNRFLRGDEYPIGKDFKAVFHSVPLHFISYIEISSIKLNAN